MAKNVKTAIILAAGVGEELKPLTETLPKCLFKIGEETVIEIILKRLLSQGIEKTCIATGHKADMIRKFVGRKYKSMDIEYVFDGRYETTGSIHSFNKVAEKVDEDVAILDSDVIFEDDLLKAVLAAKDENVVSVIFKDKLSADDYKVEITNGKVTAVGRKIAIKEGLKYGVLAAINKFSRRGLRELKEAVVRLIKKNKVDEFYEYAINSLVHKIDIYPVDVSGYRYVNINYATEIKKANDLLNKVLDFKGWALHLGASGAEVIDCENIVFEPEKSMMKCITCEHYNKNAACPPFKDSVDYQKLIRGYGKGLIVWVERDFNKDNYEEVRVESSKTLHLTLLQLEKIAFGQGLYYATSFIGGSCKLCLPGRPSHEGHPSQEGCPSHEFCVNPAKARKPLESVGVDVIAMCRNIGLELPQFPVSNKLYRAGLFLVSTH